MKITIDTKEDSHEDIKKVLKMLEAWIEGHAASPIDMFGNMGSSSESSETSSPAESGTDLFSLFDDKDEDKPGTIVLDSDDKKGDDTPPVTTY